MTPERWQQIDRLFKAALGLEANHRAVFIDRIEDESLRNELESLIASYEQGGSFLENAAVVSAAAALANFKGELAVGQFIGHYQILGTLGLGGMGEVYLARDTQLGRRIALKLLPSYLSTDDECSRRFAQEARVASALDHPNICVVHEVGRSQDGKRFIVMEYVDGVTLRQKVTEARMEPSEVLDVSVQIASALSAAHEAGIIHRDIKPENVMLRRDGYVKLLDFGIAKLADKCKSRDYWGSTAPTKLQMKTSTGAVLGTSSYMSPEQARGLAVDARTDIWSLGVVLYEMTAGRLPFEGATTGDLIVSILDHEPRPLSEFYPEAPAELQRIICNALQKKREERYQKAADLLIDLKRIKQELDFKAKLNHSQPPNSNYDERLRGARQAMHLRPRWWASRLIWLCIAVIFLVAIGVRFYPSGVSVGRLVRSDFGSPLPPMRVVPVTSVLGAKGTPAISPDGNQIAFFWVGEKGDNKDIYVKLIDAGAPLRLTTNPACDFYPAWSPDGRYIAFARFSEREKGIYIVPALGGTERKVFSPDWVSIDTCTIAWSPDGKYLAYVDRSSPQTRYGIWLISVESLERRQITSPPQQDLMDAGPSFSPDGETLSFARQSSAESIDIYLVSVGGGDPKRLTFDNSGNPPIGWTPDGTEVLFTSFGGGEWGLWRLPVTGGTAQRVTVGDNSSISRQGHRMIYMRGFYAQSIWKIDMPKPEAQRILPTRFVPSTMMQSDPQFSPDGTRVAFQAGWFGRSLAEIWVCDSDGSNPLKLTSLDSLSEAPRWSPDGRYIAFHSRVESPRSAIYVISADGGKARRLTTGDSDDLAASWSRDGRWIYFASNRSGENQVWKAPAEGGEVVRVTKEGGFAAFESPDGRYVYYAKDVRAPGIWRLPVEGGEETQILTQPKGDHWDDWALVDGGIYYINTDVSDQHIIEFFSFATRKVKQVAAMEKVAPIWPSGLAVAPDQRSILYTQVDQNQSDIYLVENFR
jgi:eukaryotic-like serine/threonine-protein kinase